MKSSHKLIGFRSTKQIYSSLCLTKTLHVEQNRSLLIYQDGLLKQANVIDDSVSELNRPSAKPIC